MARAFIIRPFGTKKDSAGKEIDFEKTQADLIDPALKEVSLAGDTTAEIIEAGNIREDMFALILEADVVICDITIHNANVFYELGIRHALRKKHTILIKGATSSDRAPFDIKTDRYTPYNIDHPKEAKDELVEALKASLNSSRETDSPIFQMLPGLSQADQSSTLVIPVDFHEEVDRAVLAGRKGWLRLLSEEVLGKRFERGGLKAIGNAQWRLKDFTAAKESWEALRNIQPNDIDANLALANIYERLSRFENGWSQLDKSDQALARVLNNNETTQKQKAEALSLKGRNQKTRWRSELDKHNKDQNRKHALSRQLMTSYEAYYEAYLYDLNHFYPGLNALQMATILLDLSTDTDRWNDIFNSDEEAEIAKKELKKRVDALRALIPLSVNSALNLMNKDNQDRIWAQISSADLLFLTSARKSRIIEAYKGAIPRSHVFAWDAARGQLELFADLGFREELARDIMESIDVHFSGVSKKKPPKPVHLVIIAGHRIDEPRRPTPRFPEEKEKKARSLIQEAFKQIIADDNYEVKGIASGASGTDILAHEICEELGISTTLCLAMPPRESADLLFYNQDNWRNRFLDLQAKKKKEEVLYLSDRKGLPPWLEGSNIDSWERGNRWVIKMAEASEADRITLIAFWDGKPSGNVLGGTAQLVELARETSAIRVHKIDANQLLH